MGLQITLTGIVAFVFFGYCYSAWKGKRLEGAAAVLCGLGFMAIPVGLVMWIWQ